MRGQWRKKRIGRKRWREVRVGGGGGGSREEKKRKRMKRMGNEKKWRKEVDKKT